MAHGRCFLGERATSCRKVVTWIQAFAAAEELAGSWSRAKPVPKSDELWFLDTGLSGGGAEYGL